MSELHELFTQLIATLRDAQHGVREEMRQIGEQKVTDLAFLSASNGRSWSSRRRPARWCS